MRGLFRYLYKNFLPANIGQSIDIFRYLRMQKVDGLKEKKILILSPHPDDDIIGCGGTLQVYKERGAKIISIYMTDGRKGNPRYNEEELVSIRREEARKAASIIGIQSVIFFDNRDGSLLHAGEFIFKAIHDLSEIFREFKPDAIFLPFLLDNHPDHIATNKILLGAMKSSPAFMCYAYGIWTPLPTFNLSVDITPYINIKKKALEEHKSKIEVADYIGASLGLSKYYSFLSGGRGWSEVFIVCPSDEYRRLARVIGW